MGGELAPLSPDALLFPELYPRRQPVLDAYEKLLRSGSDEELSELFGLKDSAEFGRYREGAGNAPTMKAVLRYDGVAYDYLDYPSLNAAAQEYVDRSVILFSNLFGPLRAADPIPDYKLKQGSRIGDFIPEKHYKEHFTAALDEWIAEREILDLRAGFYDKFYVPRSPAVTMKFLKGGKAVSHWAKAYRGKVLRESALNGFETVSELLAHNIEGLKLEEIVETKKKKEIVYSIY